MPLLLLWSLSSCSSEKIDVMFECASPDGSLIATLYRVSDGDRAIDWQTRLNVRPVSLPFDDGMFSFSMRHGYDAIIHWQGSEALALTYPLDAELTHIEHVIFGTSQTFDADRRLRVSYDEKRSTHGYFMVEKRCYHRSIR